MPQNCSVEGIGWLTSIPALVSSTQVERLVQIPHEVRQEPQRDIPRPLALIQKANKE
jgi:hypothetical protein